MSETTPQTKIQQFEFRANLPRIVRVAAVCLIAVVLVAVGIGFYRARNNEEFRIKGMPALLSKDVVAVVNGYERSESENDRKKYLVRADKATTFSDNHQELENAYFEVYAEGSDVPDKLTANRAIYVPAQDKNFDAYLDGNVEIETRDELKIRTEQIAYNKLTDTAESDQPVEFSRENLFGKSIGAKVLVKERRVELLNRVELESSSRGDESGEPNGNSRDVRITGDWAAIDQNAERAEVLRNVKIYIAANDSADSAKSSPTKMRAEKAFAYFVEKKVQRLELSENVVIDTSSETDSPTQIRAARARYFLNERTVLLNGDAEITRTADTVKGDEIYAELTPENKLKKTQLRGNAYVKQVNERITEISSVAMEALFDANQKIYKAIAKDKVNANSAGTDNQLSLSGSDTIVVDLQSGILEKMVASGASSVTLIPNAPKEYSRVTLNSPRAINLTFRVASGTSVLSQMQTEGRTTINMIAPADAANAADKKLTADSVKSILAPNGKDLQKAEAVGNAELYVEPQKSAPENFRTTIKAPRFDCEFYETGNDAKVCVAAKNAKAVMIPTVPTQNRGTRNLWAEKLVANFSRTSHDVERLDAIGRAKFNEGDRFGTASEFSYTAIDEVVKLRGEPLVWDSKARGRADEIDWDTRNEKSSLRGRVSTTYYSQKQTNGATPFGKNESPVFLTSNNAEFDHKNEVGIYLGNARAWQEDNYVRAERLVVDQKNKRLTGDEKVQSLLYNARRREGDKVVNMPASASSDHIQYSDEQKVIHYEGNVDIRQGTERILAGLADIFLDERGELKQMIAQTSVVITQPKRRVRGNYVKYDSVNETALLRGDPAIVEDAENGVTQGTEIDVSTKDNRIVNQGTGKTNRTGRTRTVYKVKGQ